MTLQQITELAKLLDDYGMAEHHLQNRPNLYTQEQRDKTRVAVFDWVGSFAHPTGATRDE